MSLSLFIGKLFTSLRYQQVILLQRLATVGSVIVIMKAFLSKMAAAVTMGQQQPPGTQPLPASL